MTPEQRYQIKAAHECGHAALALRVGMLGDNGVSINDTQHEAGSTSICWDIRGLRDPYRIKQRATIAMAGVAADFDRRKQLRQLDECMHSNGKIDWYCVCCLYADLRPDIEKARRLHLISQDVEGFWPRIESQLSEKPQPTEDEILDVIFSGMKSEQPTYEFIGEYFNCARAILSKDQPRRFIEQASKCLIEGGQLSSCQCRLLWENIVLPNRIKRAFTLVGVAVVAFILGALSMYLLKRGRSVAWISVVSDGSGFGMSSEAINGDIP